MATSTAGRFDTPEGAEAADVGIDADFIDAVFVLSSDAVLDEVEDAFAGTRPELVHTDLSGEQEARLREAFTEAA